MRYEVVLLRQIESAVYANSAMLFLRARRALHGMPTRKPRLYERLQAPYDMSIPMCATVRLNTHERVV